ncbi:MAG TPA: alpha/beta hydrolase [Candidatus Baltobacteraceae bacterium]|nr:alpha/beta hydrolase [Candidatus Baltobacteraceae bacterium]
MPCSQLSTLRALHRDLVYLRNPRTGDGVEYLVVGDGAKGNDVLVYFPGTGQILPGWPAQLITNSTYSPKIASVPGFRKNQDGKVSLCHDYRLVFFDYPGVGRTKAVTFTKDDVASDVDAMLEDVAVKFGISTDSVDPVGWSLGTTNALKYAFLSPVSRPSRTIHNVILYSAHGGGSVQAGGSGSASCVQTLFEASLTASGSLATLIKEDLTELIFPFKGQGPNQNGTHSGCRAHVGRSSVHLSVTPVCNAFNGCTQYIDDYLADINTSPWRITKGLDDEVYTQEREQSGDWNVAYCAQALSNFTSGECTAYGTIQQSSTNGGICKTNTTNTNKPLSLACNALAISGKVTLLDGYEDLLVQWTYDRALSDGLNRAKAGLATYKIYPGATGHGILIQHPRWTQAMTYAAMQH